MLLLFIGVVACFKVFYASPLDKLDYHTDNQDLGVFLVALAVLWIFMYMITVLVAINNKNLKNCQNSEKYYKKIVNITSNHTPPNLFQPQTICS